MLYTIVPPEFIFDDSDEEAVPKKLPEVEIKYGQLSLLGQSIEGGQFKINRIISSDPKDYLNPQLQPGSVINGYNSPN